MKFISDVYDDVNKMLEDFEENASILDGVDLMVVEGESEYYQESLACIYRKNDKYYCFQASHCSCYGFEGLWEENEATLKAIKHWAENGEYELKNCAKTFLENLEGYNPKFNELEQASKPLIDFLNKYYDPMTKAVVTEGHVEILSSEMGMPLEVRD